MPKESGLGITCAVDDAGGTVRGISNDITSLTWAMPSTEQDVTGLTSSAMERLLLLADFTFTLTGVFNFAANQSHDVFRHVNLTSVTRTVTITHSAQILETECLFNDYAVNRAADGSLVWTAPGELNETVVPAWTI